MEENHTQTSPIAGEPATVNDLVLAVSQQYHGLMSLRAMLVQACNEAPLENEALLEQALIQVDTLLGITEPADEEMPADYWDGELKAEADAERQADAAYELAAELASCDWEGWN